MACNDGTPIGSDPPEAWISEEHMVRDMRAVQEENLVLRGLLESAEKVMRVDGDAQVRDFAERIRAALGRKG